MKWCAKKKALGWSQRKCDAHLLLSPESLHNWQKQYKEMYRESVGSMHAGPKSQLVPIKDKLLQFIFAQREQGVSVSQHGQDQHDSKVWHCEQVPPSAQFCVQNWYTCFMFHRKCRSWRMMTQLILSKPFVLFCMAPPVSLAGF